MNLCGAMAMLILMLTVAGDCAHADVIVVSNRSPQTVKFRVVSQKRAKTSHTVITKALVSIPVAGSVELRYGKGKFARALLVDPNSVCFFFHTKEGRLDFNQIGFATSTATQLKPKTPIERSLIKSTVCKIPVKILVDDEEPFVQKRWEARLRKRMREASDIIEQHCRVRFEVVAVEMWDSNNDERSFTKMLAEFEREVKAEPAALAIGFSSQKQAGETRRLLGGTFAPLRRYILIREWSKNMSDPERLEVLLHELGHYLGATHSPEPSSVMRPRLSDEKAVLRSFRIGYDPVNTLIMCLVGEEIHAHKVRRINRLSAPARRKLRSIYAEIAKITPDDPATARLLQLVSDDPPE